MRTTKRTGETPDNNFFEVTRGETPNKIEVATNSKGQAQFTITLHYASPTELTDRCAHDLSEALNQVTATLYDHNVRLAGEVSETSDSNTSNPANPANPANTAKERHP